MKKSSVIRIVVVLALLSGTLVVMPPGGATHAAQRRGKGRPASLCPDPTVRCPTSVEFQPYQLPFRLPENAFIYETEKFYAVILKSVRDTAQDCTVFISEAERLAAQELFPRHKVFTSRCSEPGEMFYSNTAPDQQFMAVYAGRTRAEAERMLAKVKATGKFGGANLRRMYTGFNGT
jgi:hypothetical protein